MAMLSIKDVRAIETSCQRQAHWADMENNNVSSRNDKGEYKIGKNTFKKWDAEIGGEDTALYTTWTMEGNWVTSIRFDAAQGRRTSTLIHGYLCVPLHGLNVPVLQYRQELVP